MQPLHKSHNYTVESTLKDPIIIAIKIWGLKTGGLWQQVQLYRNIGPGWVIILSFKTGGVSWQWSLKIGVTCTSTQTVSTW